MNNDFNAYLLARRIIFLARHPVLELYVVEGELDGVSARVLVADDGSTLAYISDLIFPTGAKETKKGKISPFKAHKLIEWKSDIVVVGTNCLLSKIYAKQGFHLIPKWINPYLPLPVHPDVLIENLKKSAKKDITRNLKKVKERGFDYEVTTDPHWFDEFYNNMYVPYAMNLYGSLAQLDSYERVRKAYKKGAGIIVRKHKQPVGGTIVFPQDGVMRNPYVGILNGDEAISREGASRALYYYVMLVAHSWGCKGVNFGSTRPFLSDGVLQYKLKWGMQIWQDELSTAVFSLATPGFSGPAQKFLEAHPFIRIIGEGFEIYDPHRIFSKETDKWRQSG